MPFPPLSMPRSFSRFSAVRQCGAAALVLIAAALGSCGNPPAKSGKPIVLCTIFSYYDAARAIAGDVADVRILLPRGTSPHDYETSIDDKVTGGKARLLIKNGMQLDDRFDKVVDGGSAKILDISKSIPQDMFLTTEEVSLGATSEPAAGAHDGHDHGDRISNPHIWLDPQIQIRAAEIIRDALSEMDPGHKATFDANATAYIDKLKTLDTDFKTATASFKTKDFIGFHEAYDYLAHRYGLRQVAAIEEIPGGGISIAQAQKVIQLIKDKNIHYIAMETAFSGQGAKTIEERTGVKTMILQPLETYDDASNSYESLMRQNLESLKTALGG